MGLVATLGEGRDGWVRVRYLGLGSQAAIDRQPSSITSISIIVTMTMAMTIRVWVPT